VYEQVLTLTALVLNTYRHRQVHKLRDSYQKKLLNTKIYMYVMSTIRHICSSTESSNATKSLYCLPMGIV